MTSAQRRYVAVEALIGATISAVLSIAFVLLLFRGSPRIPVAGPSGLIVDALPQGFAIALMATLVPTLLTRRRLTMGKVAATGGQRRPMPLAPYALGMAGLGAALTAALTSLLLVVGVRDVALAVVLLAKPAWGFLLGGAVGATATRAALAGR